jgi:hypothetical protein
MMNKHINVTLALIVVILFSTATIIVASMPEEAGIVSKSLIVRMLDKGENTPPDKTVKVLFNSDNTIINPKSFRDLISDDVSPKDRSRLFFRANRGPLKNGYFVEQHTFATYDELKDLSPFHIECIIQSASLDRILTQ